MRNAIASLAVVLGLGSTTAGALLVSVPLGLIVGGLGLATIGVSELRQ